MKKTIISLMLALATVCCIAQNAHLQGRRILGTIVKPAIVVDSEGIVVVQIWVDQYGNVQKAVAGAEGTTLVDKKVWTAVRTAAMGTHFNISADAPALQEGTITYIFKTNDKTDAGDYSSQPRLDKAIKYLTVRDIVEKQYSGLQYVKAKFYETYSTSDLLFTIEDEDYIIPVKLVKKDLGATKRFAALNLSKGDTLVIRGRVNEIRVEGGFFAGLEDAVIIDEKEQPAAGIGRQALFHGR